jgi:uncharacterized protein
MGLSSAGEHLSVPVLCPGGNKNSLILLLDIVLTTINYMIQDSIDYKNRIIPILKRYCVPKAAFFGSFVNGKFQKGKSDIDILVLPPKGMSLLDFIGLQQEIADSIGNDVDLVSYNGISTYLKDSILANEHVFYEA